MLRDPPGPPTDGGQENLWLSFARRIVAAHADTAVERVASAADSYQSWRVAYQAFSAAWPVPDGAFDEACTNAIVGVGAAAAQAGSMLTGAGSASTPAGACPRS
jgi:hypothetical protein